MKPIDFSLHYVPSPPVPSSHTHAQASLGDDKRPRTIFPCSQSMPNQCFNQSLLILPQTLQREAIHLDALMTHTFSKGVVPTEVFFFFFLSISVQVLFSPSIIDDRKPQNCYELPRMDKVLTETRQLPPPPSNKNKWCTNKWRLTFRLFTFFSLTVLTKLILPQNMNRTFFTEEFK